MLRLRRPTPAMVVAMTALLVALGGTGIAAVSILPPNSVGVPQLKEHAVVQTKISHGAIDSVLVKNGSLLAADFAAGQLPAGSAGPPGPTGPQGPVGPQGTAGAKGEPGVVTGLHVLTEQVTVNDPSPAGTWKSESVTQYCPSGEKAIAGGTGWSSASSTDALSTVYMRPVLEGDTVVAYHARGGNATGTSRVFTVYVLCYKG